MKTILNIVLLLLPLIKGYDPSKMLIIYFTKTNNTQLFANYIKNITGIETHKIVPVGEYEEDSKPLVNISKEQWANENLPEIKDPLTDISKYDTLLIGYPLWHSHLPNIVAIQIKKLDLKGKVIYPFNTFGTTGIGNSVDDIKTYVEGAEVKEGFAISQQEIKLENISISQIKKWVKKNLEGIDDEGDSDNLENDLSLGYSLQATKFNYFIILILYILL